MTRCHTLIVSAACAQVGVALAVVLITYFKLSHISSFHVNVGNHTYNATGTCLLDSNTSAPSASLWGLCQA